MNCYSHPDRAAVQRCEKCGKLLCQECSLAFEGRSVCKVCVRNAIDAEPAYAPRVKYPHARSHNLLVVFILAICVPGAAHMYMGLMKRGLLILSSLFLSIWFAVELGGTPFFGFLIAIICITEFFDAMHIRKRIVTGEYVDDNFSDIIGAVKRFRLPITIFLVYILASAVFRNGPFNYGYYSPFYYNSINIGNIVKVGLFIAIAAALLGSRKKRKSYDEPIDKREPDDDRYQ